MRIGIISEGKTDLAVITNIICGITGLDASDLIPLRPKLSYDKTDLAEMDQDAFSNWTLVKQECLDRTKIDQFLAIEGQEFIVIHLDTAESEEYGVTKPKKDENYCNALRQLVLEKINEWLQNNTDNILHAIAIEETEAWILASIEKRDSSDSVKPKEKLQYILNKKKIDTSLTFENYLKLSKDLSKTKVIMRNKILENNCSLFLFYNEVLSKYNDYKESLQADAIE